MGGLGLEKSIMEQLGIQSLAVGVTIVWSIVATIVIAFIVKLVIGLRVTPEQEQEALDSAEHGETAYPE